MTRIAADLAKSFAHLAVEHQPDMPDTDLVLAPATAEDAAAVLDAASEHRLSVLMWGGGHHQGYGNPVAPDVILTTARLDRLVGWSPGDLTATVEAGFPLAGLAEHLATQAQTAVAPDGPGTIGGAVAAGRSGWARLRYGPLRDRVLEAVLVTGDGRVVRGGAPLVKNVTGYDIPRLVTGSFGSLGLVIRVALKLWPLGTARATVTVDDPVAALATAYRPLAVIAERARARVYLSGTPAEVDGQATALGGSAEPGHVWPEPLAEESILVLRVPPGLTQAAIARVPNGWSFQGSFGVGEVRIGGNGDPRPVLEELRSWAASVGGAAVVERIPSRLYHAVEPWGDPGSSVELQRRVKAAFDPLAVCNPGRLPGGL